MADNPQAKIPPGQDVGAHPDASRFFRSVASHYQHVIVVEGSHHDFREIGRAVTTNPSVYKGLQEAGVKHNLMELPQDEQELFHAYYNRDPKFFGVASKDQNKREMVAERIEGKSEVRPGDLTGDHDRKMQFAEIIDLSRGKMQVWAMDKKDDTPSTFNTHLDTESLAIHKQLQDKGVTEQQIAGWLNKEYKLGPEDSAKIAARGEYVFMVKELHGAAKFEKQFGLKEGTLVSGVEKATEAAKQDSTRRRFEVDERVWAQYIRDHVPAGEKTFSSGLGSSHTSNKHNSSGIDEILGGDTKAATLLVAANDKQINEAWQSKDPPHAIIDTRDNTVIIGEKLGLPGYKAGDRVKLEDFREIPAAPAAAPQTAPGPANP